MFSGIRSRIYLAMFLPLAALMMAGAVYVAYAATQQPDIGAIAAQADSVDPKALEKLRWLACEDAIPILQHYLSLPKADQKLRGKAVEVLREIKPYPFYEKRLAEESAAQSAGVEILLDQLALLKTKESVRIIGKYLYDDRKPQESHGDVDYPSFSYAAAEALGNIELNDAPVKTAPDLYRENELTLWR